MFVVESNPSNQEDTVASQRERQLDAILASIPDVICVYNTELRYEYASAAIERATGIPSSAFIGKTHVELGFPSEMAAQFDAGLREVLTTGASKPFEYSFSQEDEIRHYIRSTVPVTEGCAVAKIVTITRDVTELKRAEAVVREQQREIQENEERLRLAIKAGNIGVWDWDIPSGRVTWSENVYRFHGLTPDKFDGSVEGFSRLLHPEDASRVHQLIEDCVATGEPYAVQFRIVRPDGAVRWITTDGTVIYEKGTGQPLRMLGANADITEQHESFRKFELVTQRLRRAQEAAKVATWEWELHTGRITWSENAQEVFAGFTLAADLTQLFAIIHPEDLVRMRAAAAQAATSPIDVQYRICNDDGSVRWLLSRARPMDEGLVVGATIDVTVAKRAEMALINSEKLTATGRLAATVAHEINNPLEAVMNLLYLLRTHPALPPDAVELAQRADEELLRVAHITRQTLAFYKGGGSARRLDLRQIAIQVESLYAREAEKKHISIDNAVQTCFVNAVDAEMRQMLSNLLSNAIAAAPHGGLVEIQSLTDGDAMLIVVADSGPGISPEVREKIFEPFFTTKRDYGTGLGLWVTHELVSRLKGTISVSKSATLGGAEFTVRIPFAT